MTSLFFPLLLVGALLLMVIMAWCTIAPKAKPKGTLCKFVDGPLDGMSWRLPHTMTGQIWDRIVFETTVNSIYENAKPGRLVYTPISFKIDRSEIVFAHIEE